MKIQDNTIEFIKLIAKACNKSQVLYCDMVHQDELFDFQEEFIDALVFAYDSKLVSQKQMLQFEHIFGLVKTD